MKSIALMLILLLLRFRNGQGIYLESPVSGDKVCVGTETGLAKLGSSSYHYKKMYRQFEDCTYVFGNLEITHLKAGQDASFLSNIRVVTGYVLLFGNEMDIPLTSLVFVRGDMTYEGYTIVIAMSPNVYLPALTEIGGSVKLFMPNCFLDSIHWQYISRGKVVRALGLEKPADKCDQCSDACAAQGHCWGPEQDMCQSGDVMFDIVA
ncbi:epidermal growth factor receptor-like [Dreissena polymorpha]|uniref:epidermal growth factor receptor-like n=1 Tax=Dreissena polymorpha TaxID=45954 RepID=UPI0022651882|nr:epidermal growth factor receptor-like [Dreissena polymorpha]